MRESKFFNLLIFLNKMLCVILKKQDLANLKCYPKTQRNMSFYRTVLQIYCVIPPHPSNLLGSEPPGAYPALKPRETGQAYPRLQVIRTVRVDKSQYYPVRESYSDASGIVELYPPIQITGVC